MADNVEVVPLGDARTELYDIVGRKFDNPPAAPAYHVIVRLVAESVFVMGLFNIETYLLEDAALD